MKAVRSAKHRCVPLPSTSHQSPLIVFKERLVFRPQRRLKDILPLALFLTLSVTLPFRYCVGHLLLTRGIPVVAATVSSYTLPFGNTLPGLDGGCAILPLARDVVSPFTRLSGWGMTDLSV